MLRSLVLPTLAEQGCIRYELNQADDGQAWVFTEQWESKALWERHMASAHVDKFRADADELVGHFELFSGEMLRPGL